MGGLKELETELRHMRARIAGHRLRQDVEVDGDLALFHKEAADALCVSLVHLLNVIDNRAAK